MVVWLIIHLGAWTLLKEVDAETAKLIELEMQRQTLGLEMIPSENLASKAVLEAIGSVFSNKYSEGYPRKRYYGGNEFVDQVEELAIERAKKLFSAEHVNVQPYSGSPANMAALFAFLSPGDKFMAMSLAHGGHLTHGHKVSFSGKLFAPVHYTVDKETELLDLDAIRKQVLEEKPKLILSGYTAYPRKIPFKEFKNICEEAQAVCMADIAHIAGLVAGKAHENPVPYFDVVTSTTHKTLRGPRGGIIMCRQEHAEKIDKSVFPFLQGGPHDNLTAAKAVCFAEALRPSFKEYAEQIVKNSRALADSLMSEGFRLVSGGTDTHLILMDLQNKEITGKEAETVLDSVGIYCNKNMVPFDPRTPFNPSGIRLGTPSLTTRGMRESEMKEVARFISRAIDNRSNPKGLEEIRGHVMELCRQFVFYD